MGKKNIVGNSNLHVVNPKTSNLKMFKAGKRWVLSSKIIMLFGTANNTADFEVDDTEFQGYSKLDGITRIASYHY